MQIYAREALEKMGASEERIAEVDAKIKKTFSVEQIDHQALSREIQKKIDAADLLKDFIRELRRTIE
ncbi:hypothetical protein D3C87_1913470 [compost metagenome]